MRGAQGATNGVKHGAQDATSGVKRDAEAAKRPLVPGPLARSSWNVVGQNLRVRALAPMWNPHSQLAPRREIDVSLPVTPQADYG